MSDLPAVTEVIEPTDISLMRTVDDLKRGVRAVLADYESKSPSEGSRSITEIWDQVCKTNDTNQNVLLIMNQAITLFQAAYDRYFATLAENDNYIKRLREAAISDTGKTQQAKMQLHNDERDRIERDKIDANKNLRGFMSEITKLAHEYRQCRTQSAYFVHVSQIQQFTSLIIAVLHQNVSNAETLEKVSKAIQNASIKLFPVEVGQDS